jgi:tRNA threonylcarbamoyladenosine biosynthesis protein TsaB
MSESLLAIETSTPACSAALSIDGVVHERYALAPRQHAALMLPMIESLLLEAGISVSELDALAFGRGPGSFTGVRIAASVIQGIAYAADLPVVPVSTLAALALGGMQKTNVPRVMAALDARKAEVYWGCFTAAENGAVVLHEDERVCAPADIHCPDGGDWVGIGSGWEAHGESLMQKTAERIVRVVPDFEPRAGDVARLGVQDYRQGVMVEPEAAVPVYLRNNVAEVKKSLRK